MRKINGGIWTHNPNPVILVIDLILNQQMKLILFNNNKKEVLAEKSKRSLRLINRNNIQIKLEYIQQMYFLIPLNIYVFIVLYNQNKF